jgi:hypothetical protein
MKMKRNSQGNSAATTTVPVTPDDARYLGGSRSGPFNKLILREVVGCLCISNRDEEDQVELAQAAMSALKAFRPSDEIEGMLATQAVALHLGAMECFRRSMIPSQPSDLASRLRRDGANLARTMVEMLEAIDRKRGKRPQVVRVERVVVQDGGQAIVGSLTTGSVAAPPVGAMEAAPASIPEMGLSRALGPAQAMPAGRGEA